jgi:DNA-directed RNA polymerase specialized sigma24 family protein
MAVRWVSPRTEAEYIGITEGTVWRLMGNHPQAEDILAQAHLEVWQKIQALPREERESLHRLVPVIARRAIIDFLRSPENRFRRESRSGAKLPVVVAWDEVAWRVRMPDFAPRLIERLHCQWLWKRLLASVDRETKILLVLYFRHGWTHAKLGRHYGHSEFWSLYRIRSALSRFREAEEL